MTEMRGERGLFARSVCLLARCPLRERSLIRFNATDVPDDSYLVFASGIGLSSPAADLSKERTHIYLISNETRPFVVSFACPEQGRRIEPRTLFFTRSGAWKGIRFCAIPLRIAP